jgi:hypothetical protein
MSLRDHILLILYFVRFCHGVNVTNRLPGQVMRRAAMPPVAEPETD